MRGMSPIRFPSEGMARNGAAGGRTVKGAKI